MEELIKLVEKELEEIAKQGLTMENLETTSKLVDMYKDLKESEEGGGGKYGMEYRDGYGYRASGGGGGGYGEGRGGGGGYREGGYREGGYREGGYREGRGGGGSYNEYGRPYMEGGSGGGGGYGAYGAPRRSYNDRGRRMREHMDRVYEGLDMYEYGKDRYQHGGSEDRMIDGLEKLMYALCMFVESAMDFTESPQEKEVIRKHIQKIRDL